MTTQPDPFALARDIASEYEEILEVKDLATAVGNLNGTLVGMANLDKRDIALAGNVASLAGLFVGLVSFIIQFRLGNMGKDQQEETIKERLINKLMKETSLPPKTRERLINKLIDTKFDLGE